MWTDLPESEVDPSTARSIADEVLSRQAYLDAARPPSLWERFQTWMFELISELFALLTSAGGRGLTGWIVVGLFSVAIIWLVVRLAQSAGPVPSRNAKPEASIDLTEGLSPSQWLEAAAQAESEGDWRSGLRCRHRALLTELIDRDVVAARPGQTAGEIAVEIGRAIPTAAAGIDDATSLFKDVWYGGVAAGPNERDRFRALADGVLDHTVLDHAVLDHAASVPA